LRISDQIAPSALGERDLENRVAYAKQTLEIKRRANRILIGVTRKTLDAAFGIGAELVDISELKVESLLELAGPQTTPIPQKPRCLGRRPLVGASNPSAQHHKKKDGQNPSAHAPHGIPPPTPIPDRDYCKCTGRSLCQARNTAHRINVHRRQKGENSATLASGTRVRTAPRIVNRRNCAGGAFSIPDNITLGSQGWALHAWAAKIYRLVLPALRLAQVREKAAKYNKQQHEVAPI